MRKKVLALSLCLAAMAAGQTLTVGAATGSGASTVPVPLTLNGASGPAGLQFTLKWPKTIAGVVPAIDSRATASMSASKSIYCSSPAPSGLLIAITCLIVGMNSNTIGNGPVADLLVTLPSGFSGTATMTIAGTLGATPDGNAMTIAGANGKVVKSSFIIGSQSAVRSPASGGKVVEISVSDEYPVTLKCEPTIIARRRVGEAAHCTLTIPEPAAEKLVVGLSSSNDTAMDFPKTVTVEAGSGEVEFDIKLKNDFNPPPWLIMAANVGNQLVIFTKLEIK